jgi:hypothetical protein
LLAGEPQHLGHERKCLHAAVLIERGEDLVDALHLDELAEVEPSSGLLLEASG